MPTPFKSPLTLYVLWHPDYSAGALLADKLFKGFSRNVDDPFARTPGIPVYFRSAPAGANSKLPRTIPFEESDYTAIIVLVDDRMVIGDEWNTYVTELDKVAAASPGKIRLFPVAVNSNSFKFPVASTNFIRLYEVREKTPATAAIVADSVASETKTPPGKETGVTINIFINGENAESVRVEHTAAKSAPPGAASASAAGPTLLDRQATFLIGKLAHELSRMLYHQPRVDDDGAIQSAAPIRMFISHAKADGAGIAAAIRNHIHSDTSLKSFFDANDIAAGYRFSAELITALRESAIICLQTDYYATREWCLWEVINAKRLDRPVVVVNAVTNREPRSFPYLGNVPTLRWRFDGDDDRTQIQEVLDLALFEVLGTRYRELLQRELIKTFELPDDTGVVGHPPELFTILKMAADESHKGRSQGEPRYVVYPDPPLGDEELRLLQDLAPNIRFITPTMLPLVQHLTNSK
jgi:hypothetical protein